LPAPACGNATLALSVPGWFYTYFVHFLSGRGYQFWSGIGSDIGEVAILGALVAFWSKHNCHVHRCWRLSWHPSKKYGGHVVCRHHHEDSGSNLLKEK